MSDTSQRPNPDAVEEGQGGAASSSVRLAAFVGATAIATSYSALLIDLASGEYGGVGLGALVCMGVPAGVFGTLGGLLWSKMAKRRGRLVPNVIPLILIGVLSGIIPGVCMRLLPQ